ncbi:MAG: major facilitator superfamily 1, partial [Ilumatobacteraceae bacterium]|nr:major facilitator superfamily 1 [Ilumatobacteraceae bacterium]
VRRTTFAWDRLTVSCVLSFCLLVCGLSVGLVLGELRDQLHLSGIVAAAHGSTFGIGLLALGSVGSKLVGRLGRPRAFATGCSAILIGVVLLCAGQTWHITLLGAALAGVGGALMVVLMPGIVADHHGQHRAAAFAAINGIPGIAGIALSLIVGGVIASGGSWRWPYLFITLAIAAALLIVVRRVQIPTSAQQPVSVLPLFRRADVRGPWLRAVNAVLVEFPVGVWAVVYLKEVGGASSGLAVILGGVWGLFLFVSRMTLPRLLHHAGSASLVVSYATAAVGALLMWTGPGLVVRAIGLSIVALGAGPLYPLAVDGLYRRGEGGRGQDGHHMPPIDSVSIGAIAALASGAAISVGPMVLGVLADLVGLHNAVLVVPALALLGIVTSWPRHPNAPQSAADRSNAPAVDSGSRPTTASTQR